MTPICPTAAFLPVPGPLLPILDFSFNGPAPTDTQFDTVEINRQYDFFTDFPLYPLNGISLANAVLGFFYAHATLSTSACPPIRRRPRPIQGKHGDTSYYFFQTEDLPLFGPLRTLGVPEPVIDVVEPFFRAVVELGYDRSIPRGTTSARLIPPHDPETLPPICSTRSARGSTTPRPSSARHHRGAFPRL